MSLDNKPAADEVEQIRERLDLCESWFLQQTGKQCRTDAIALLSIVDQQRAIMPQVTELLDAVDLYFRKAHYVQQAKFDVAARLESAYVALKAALKESTND